MERKTINARLRHLENIVAQYHAMTVVDHDLLVTLTRAQPAYSEVLDAFTARRERLIAQALGSALPADEWLLLLQAQTENTLEDCGRHHPGR